MLCHPSQSLSSLSFLSLSIPCSRCLIRCSVIYLFICRTVLLVYNWRGNPNSSKVSIKDFANNSLCCFTLPLALVLNARCCGVAELNSLEMSSQSNTVYFSCIFLVWFSIYKVCVSISGDVFVVCSTLVGITAHYGNFVLVFSPNFVVNSLPSFEQNRHISVNTSYVY